MKTRCPSILFFLLAIITAVANVSGTSYVTMTATFMTNAVCGVMVTGDSSSSVTNCRRRRNYWIDVPSYIALNDDVDSQLVQYFNPTRTYQVEPTVWPFRSNHQQIDYHPAYWPAGSFPTAPSDVVQPSMSALLGGEQRTLTVGLSALLSLFNNMLMAAISPAAATTASEVTQTLTQTVTVTSGTKTIFLSGCKPVPFPFSTCQ